MNISVEPERESEGEDTPDLLSDEEDLHDQFDDVDIPLPLDNVDNEGNNYDLEQEMTDVTGCSSSVLWCSKRLKQLSTSSDSVSSRSPVRMTKVDVSKSTLTTMTPTESDESVQCVGQKSPEKVHEPPKEN